jgi:predicted DNA-binding transcriptional regulator YafY
MRTAERVAIFAPGMKFDEAMRTRFDLFALAIEQKRKAFFAYQTLESEGSERTVRPLALAFWGGTWTLAAWCELRDDFRTFGLDRAENVPITDDRFTPERGRSLDDYLASVTRAP